MKPEQIFHQYLSIIVGAVIIAGSIFLATDKIGNLAKTVPTTNPGVEQPTVVQPSDTGNKPADTANQPQPTATDISGVTLENVLGKANAPVTIVEFSDFQCPFCERWYQQVKKQLVTDYIDTGKAKFVYKPYAFLGPDSTTAAEGLYCAADQNKFWEYHDYLFEHQGKENGGWVTLENVKKMAKEMGLNTTTFNNCMDTNKYKDKVAQALQEGQKIGVNGTPATFINGVFIPGAQPYTTFKTEIDKQLGQ